MIPLLVILPLLLDVPLPELTERIPRPLRESNDFARLVRPYLAFEASAKWNVTIQRNEYSVFRNVAIADKELLVSRAEVNYWCSEDWDHRIVVSKARQDWDRTLDKLVDATAIIDEAMLHRPEPAKERSWAPLIMRCDFSKAPSRVNTICESFQFEKTWLDSYEFLRPTVVFAENWLDDPRFDIGYEF